MICKIYLIGVIVAVILNAVYSIYARKKSFALFIVSSIILGVTSWYGVIMLILGFITYKEKQRKNEGRQ